MAKECAFCRKKLEKGDSRVEVNKYTFKENEDHWKEFHDKQGVHIILKGWPSFGKPKAN